MHQKGDRLRVGVIGVGYLGRFHAEKFSAMEDVDLVGVVDVNKSQAKDIARVCRTHSFQDYKELPGKVDAVSIVTPTSLHFAIGRYFLKNDIDVMIEKPITADIEQAEELIRIAKSRGRIIQVGHLERFNPAFVAAQTLIHSPRMIEAARKNAYKPRGTDVSVVLDLMIHDLDLVLSLIRADITDVRAAGMAWISEHTDVATARIEFADGSVANITASRLAARNERKMHCYQSDGHIAVDFADHKVTIMRKNFSPHNDQAGGIDLQTRALPKGDALMQELTAFVKAVRLRETPVVSGEMGRDALKIAMDVMAEIEKIAL